jgi:hypothetical protein
VDGTTGALRVNRITLGTGLFGFGAPRMMESIESFQGLSKPCPLEREHDQQVHVRIVPLLAVGIGTKQDDFFRMKLLNNPFTQLGNSLFVYHVQSPWNILGHQ